MSDAVVVGLALAVGLSAFLALPVPLLIVVGAAILLVLYRNALWLLTFCVLFVSWSADRSWSALDQPVERHVAGIATLTKDPQYMFGSQRAEVDMNGRRYQLWAAGGSASALRPLLAGQRVVLEGTTSALTGLGVPSQRRKHVVARLNADRLEHFDNGNTLNRVANSARAFLGHGLSYLPRDSQALALGMTIGDDRQQSEADKQMFRDANLAHLTAVSGANVVFVLAMVAPLLLCFSLRGRLIGGCAVLLIFGVMTRFEPSVLRAEAMAAMFLVAAHLGRPLSLVRALGLGATLVVLTDPFIVGSIGFLLSVSACVGMAVMAPLMVKALPGPDWLAKAIGFALGAQVGVAPVQIFVFGSVPTVGIVANLIAGPFAGLVMVSATIGSVLVNVFGSWVAPIALAPTQLFADFITLVARVSVGLDWGSWSLAKLLPVGTALLLLMALNTTTFKQRVVAARLSHQRRRSVAGQPSG